MNIANANMELVNVTPGHKMCVTHLRLHTFQPAPGVAGHITPYPPIGLKSLIFRMQIVPNTESEKLPLDLFPTLLP